MTFLSETSSQINEICTSGLD